MAKVLIRLDEWPLDRLDREAVRRGMSRSALIAVAAATELGAPLGPGARPQSRQAMERIAALFTERVPAGDSTLAIRAMRDERAERDAQLR